MSYRSPSLNKQPPSPKPWNDWVIINSFRPWNSALLFVALPNSEAWPPSEDTSLPAALLSKLFIFLHLTYLAIGKWSYYPPFSQNHIHTITLAPSYKSSCLLETHAIWLYTFPAHILYSTFPATVICQSPSVLGPCSSMYSFNSKFCHHPGWLCCSCGQMT